MMLDTTFEDAVVIVTGSGSGIGAATAIGLAKRGASVGVFDLNQEAAQHVADSICAAGGTAFSYAMDVSSGEDWQQAVSDVAARFGYINGLVNNAGLTRDKTIVKMAELDWDRVIDVNLKGAWLGARHVIPYMKEHGGAIVNLSSESQYGEFGQTNYSAAKAGISGLTRSLALELARYQIRCNAVAPGSVDTPMTQAVDESIRESWLESIPMHRLGKPEEIASVVCFLLGPDASYITGQVLGVNGGSSR